MVTMQAAGRIAGHVLLFAVCTVGSAIAAALLGGFVGGLIGESLGTPEGEGFIGFLYGLRIGGGIGVIGGFLAYLWLRRIIPSHAAPPKSAHVNGEHQG
jgi:hypothetical protein